MNLSFHLLGDIRVNTNCFVVTRYFHTKLNTVFSFILYLCYNLTWFSAIQILSQRVTFKLVHSGNMGEKDTTN